jgi:hypothetical protein
MFELRRSALKSDENCRIRGNDEQGGPRPEVRGMWARKSSRIPRCRSTATHSFLQHQWMLCTLPPRECCHLGPSCCNTSSLPSSTPLINPRRIGTDSVPFPPEVVTDKPIMMRFAILQNKLNL